jgi:uncharacterized damage-inducible protein DinB
MTYYSGRDLARNFRTVRKNTLMIANEIPEAQYGYRAAPGTRSVGELLAHIAASSHWTHRVHAVEKPSAMTFEDFGRYGQENMAYEQTLTTKAAIIKALESEGENFASWMETAPDPILCETVTFPAGVEPLQKTRFEMLLSAKEHEMHHRGQLMLVQRMIGIVPHLTRQREARSGVKS